MTGEVYRQHMDNGSLANDLLKTEEYTVTHAYSSSL